MIDYKVPFYSNTPDDTHCFQAALKMVLKFFQPQKDFSWQELEIITAKKGNLWTWPLAGLLWLADNGFDVKNTEIFDYKRFTQEGGKYLIEIAGKEVGEAQITNSDIPQEMEYAKSFLKKIGTAILIPTINDIKEKLRAGYLVICNVNAHALNQKPGYTGHFVVAKGFNEKGLLIHDPGLPALEYRLVEEGIFESAWAYPNPEAKNLMAVKMR